MNRSKFDIDLDFGRLLEKWLESLFYGETQGRVEVKTERDLWLKTGAIAFEVECRGRPSGLETTEAEWWAHVLTVDGRAVGMYFWRTSVLRERLHALRELKKDGPVKEVSGGDDNASKLLLVPLDCIHLLFPRE